MALVAITLLPMLASGFYGDDEANSLVTSTLLAVKGQGLFGVIWSDIISWVTSVGRFFPLSEYTRILFVTVNGNPLTYKIILMALVLLDAALLYAFVGRLTKSPHLSAVAVLVLSVTLQFRFYHEPILSYTGMLPIITALVLAALLWFVDYLDSGKKKSLARSVTAFAASLLIYEVALPMCAVFVALAWTYPRKRSVLQALRSSWAYLCAAFLAGGLVLVFRFALHFQPSTTGQVSGYQFNLSPVPVLTTIVKQVVAAFPLTHYGSRMLASVLGLTVRPMYDSPLAYVREHPSTTLLGAAAFLAVSFFVLRPLFSREEQAPSSETRALTMVGLGFLILPNLLISLASRHQLGVEWGQGYLPVFISAFGVALLATAMFDQVRRAAKIRRMAIPVTITLALVFAVGGAVNFDNNRLTVEGLNRTESYTAAVAAKALAAGILAPVPDGSWVLSNVGTAWQVPDFYRLHAGKTVAGASLLIDSSSLIGLPLLAASRPSAESTSYAVDPSGPPIFYLYVESSTRDAGYAVLSRISSVSVTPAEVSVTGTPMLAYRTWPQPAPYDWLQVKGWPSRPASYAPASAVDAPLVGSPVLSSGPDWVLQSAPEGWAVTQVGFDPGKGRSWLDYPRPAWSLTP